MGARISRIQNNHNPAIPVAAAGMAPTFGKKTAIAPRRHSSYRPRTRCCSSSRPRASAGLVMVDLLEETSEEMLPDRRADERPDGRGGGGESVTNGPQQTVSPSSSSTSSTVHLGRPSWTSTLHSSAPSAESLRLSAQEGEGGTHDDTTACVEPGPEFVVLPGRQIQDGRGEGGSGGGGGLREELGEGGEGLAGGEGGSGGGGGEGLARGGRGLGGTPPAHRQQQHQHQHRTLLERLLVWARAATRGGGLPNPRGRGGGLYHSAQANQQQQQQQQRYCPFCAKPLPSDGGGAAEEQHLLSCVTSPPLPYNEDVLSKDLAGLECCICLDELVQGQTIARLACLCVYHKACIDAWARVKPCCPEHPFDD